jgi:CheY-like chemotaxis protein
VSDQNAAELLIVEDTLTQAMMIKHLLEGNGFIVTIARSAADAFVKLETLRPKAILTDINMPEMDGYQLARKLKEDQNLAQIPVILLTSFLEAQDIFKIIESKADNFIFKCYEEDYFVPRLSAMLQSIEMRSNGNAQVDTVGVHFRGQASQVTLEQPHAIDMLLSSFETNVYQNKKSAKADASQ